MTDRINSIIRKGGKLTKKQFNLLLSYFPEEIYTEYGETIGSIAHRLCHRLYIHEARGYCVAKENYILYEEQRTKPDIDKVEEFIADKDREEAMTLQFYDLTKEHAFSSYEALMEYVHNKGGTEAFNLKNITSIKKVISDKSGLDDEAYATLFQHRNYIQEDIEHDRLVAVVWLNDFEYCCLDAWYYRDELGRVRSVCSFENDIRRYSHGVQTDTIKKEEPVFIPPFFDEDNSFFGELEF